MPTLNKEIIDIATSTQSVNDWIDAKNIGDERAAELKEGIGGILAKAVSRGYLVFNDDGSINQTLFIPLTKTGASEPWLTSMDWRSRVTPNETNRMLNKLGSASQNETCIGYAALHTGQPVVVIESLEQYDRNLVNAIVQVFF